MIAPVGLQLSRAKGFSLQALSLATNGLTAIKVDRTTMWGNRWKIGTHSNLLGRPVETNAEAVEVYRKLAWREPHARAWVRERLRGANLACWCGLGEPCHREFLIEVANGKAAP
jgi:hypothetical protein